MEDLQTRFNEAIEQAREENKQARYHKQLADLFSDSAVAMLRRNRFDIGYRISDSDVERICDNLAVVGLSEAQALIEPLVGFDYAVKAERFELMERDIPNHLRCISFQIGKRHFRAYIPLAAAYDVPGFVPEYRILCHNCFIINDPFPVNVRSKFEQKMKDEKET